MLDFLRAQRARDHWITIRITGAAGKTGQFTTVVYEITEDPTVRDQMIRSGDADITATVPLDSLDSLEMTEGVTTLDFLAHVASGGRLRPEQSAA